MFIANGWLVTSFILNRLLSGWILSFFLSFFLFFSNHIKQLNRKRIYFKIDYNNKKEGHDLKKKNCRQQTCHATTAFKREYKFQTALVLHATYHKIFNYKDVLHTILALSLSLSLSPSYLSFSFIQTFETFHYLSMTVVNTVNVCLPMKVRKIWKLLKKHKLATLSYFKKIFYYSYCCKQEKNSRICL